MEFSDIDRKNLATICLMKTEVKTALIAAAAAILAAIIAGMFGLLGSSKQSDHHPATPVQTAPSATPAPSHSPPAAAPSSPSYQKRVINIQGEQINYSEKDINIIHDEKNR